MNRTRTRFRPVALAILLGHLPAIAQSPGAVPSVPPEAQVGAMPHANAAASMSLSVTAAGKIAAYRVADLQTLPQKTASVHNAHRNAEETHDGVVLTDVLAKAGAGAGAARKPLVHSYIRL